MSETTIFIFGMSLFIAGTVFGQTPLNEDLQTVTSVDLNRYTGTWYEISRLPNRFQRDCAKNTTATYNLQDDGKIQVINRCVTAEGKEKSATGIAEVVNTETNAKLRVSFVQIFGLSLFWGDYWIIGLDPDYAYAVVGTPSRKYGWILSRSPQLTPDQETVINALLKEQGYNPDDFVKTPQDDAS